MHHPPLVLKDEQRQQLMHLIRRPTTARRMVERALTVLAAADGKGYRAIAQEHRLSRNTVRKWCRRFAIQGLAALADMSPPH